jgi:histidinol-phosphate/aromatic aminotransferase/cobyric acid decarboxylase-like protein
VREALTDHVWQTQARMHLQQTSERLVALLTKRDMAPSDGCALFQWCRRADAATVHRALAQRGILTRLFDTPSSLRFGLPPNDAAFERLDANLAEVLR